MSAPADLTLAWYCPSEGDGRRLGTARPERPPDFDYLVAVARAAEDAGAREILIPTGVVNDSFAPDAPFMESWTTASALAARTSAIRLIVAVNPGAVEIPLVVHQATTLARIAPGRIAINLVAGGGPDVGHGAPRRDHAARYARLAELADALAAEFPGPLYLGGASEAALRLARRRAGAYLMWGEPPDRIAARIAPLRRARPDLRFGLRIHIIARADAAAAEAAAAELVAGASARAARAGEYAAFDSAGQARMNALPAARGWVEPGLWAGIREVRGGAGTALVGSYARVAGLLGRYRAAGVDVVIASGYPHLEEVERVAHEVWPRLARERAGGPRPTGALA